MEEGDDETIDIAASMGFSSFGSLPNKKRKYDSKTDAVTDAPPRKGNQGNSSGSGSNKMPLGKARPKKIDAHGDREVDGTGQSLAFGVAMGGGDAVDDPGYMDDTPPDSPVRTLHNAAIEQSRGEDQALQGTDLDLCNRAPMPTVPLAVEDEKSQRLPQKPLNTMPTHPSLPSKPPAAWNSSTSGASGSNVGRAGGSDNDLWKLRKGVRNETGDIAYYDPSFVEDPWQELLENHVRMDKG